MYKYTRYVYAFTPEDEVYVDIEFARPGPPTGASVHNRAEIDGKWVDMLRYDDAHGVAHRHRFWRGDGAGEPLGVPMTPTQLVEAAKDDIRENWERYRRQMENHR